MKQLPAIDLESTKCVLRMSIRLGRMPRSLATEAGGTSMELRRYALIGLSNPRPTEVLSCNYDTGDGAVVNVVDVHEAELSTEPTSLEGQAHRMSVTWPAPHEEAVIVVSAKIQNLIPEVTESGALVIPVQARSAAERAIESFADLLAVSHQCRRSIRTPTLCVSLHPEPEGEFRDVKGILPPSQVERPSRPRVLPPLCLPEVIESVWTRTEGVALLANSLSEQSPIGRSRDLFRLIEAAFGAGLNTLQKPLYEYLRDTPHDMDYTKKETDRWIGLRGPVMHADKRIANSEDVTPVLPRLEWAAYDILLHKRNWGVKDTARAAGRLIQAGTQPDGTETLFGVSGVVHFDSYDPVGVYPLDSRCQIGHPGAGSVALTCYPAMDGYAKPVMQYQRRSERRVRTSRAERRRDSRNQ